MWSARECNRVVCRVVCRRGDEQLVIVVVVLVLVLAIHAKRVTVMPKDIQLARRIRGERA